MHNGNKSYNWVILPSGKVKAKDPKGISWLGTAVIKKGKIQYITDAWEVKK